MLINTKEKMKKRQEEFDRENISRLRKQIKSKGTMPVLILQTKYGLDLDFDNQDWGIEKEKKHE
jgi:hypothetical protein